MSYPCRALRALPWVLIVLALGALGGAIRPALAQERSVSYSTWSVSGDRIILRFLLPIPDAQRVAGTPLQIVTSSVVGNYLLEHVAVHAGGEDCPAIDQGYDIGKVDPLTVAAGLYGFEIFFRCPALSPGGAQAPGLVLQDRALFERLPGQVNFARVQVNGSGFSEQLFTSHHQELALERSSAPPGAGLARYVALGAAHIVGSLNRLCFLLGSLLLLRRPRQAGEALAGLAAGYALSLAVALTTPIVPRANLLNAFIGFLIACSAAQIATRQLARARLVAIGAAGVLLWLAAAALLAHTTIWPVLLLAGAALFAGSLLAARPQLEAHSLSAPLLPAVFGFLDGLVLPGALIPLSLNARTVLPMLTGFDLGALLMGAAVVGVLALVMGIAARLHQPHERQWTAGLLRDLSAAALGGFGVFWLLSGLRG